MRVRILPSARSDRIQYLTSFLIDDEIAIDAGCLGFHAEPDDQARVNHVFLTHTHSDHIGSLPIFIENRSQQPVTLYGHPRLLDTLKTDIFNDRIWPDLFRRDPGCADWIRLVPLEDESPISVGRFKVTPVPVSHTVPTFGLIVEDEQAAVVFGSDSGPTNRIWELARGLENLKAAFIEASFPNRLAAFARQTAHLTPELLRGEVAKLPPEASVVAVHIKPKYHDEVIAELQALRNGSLEVGTAGKEYAF